MAFARSAAHGAFLAWRQIAADRAGAACLIFAVIAAALPMLLLLALKNGVVGGMIEDLVRDPRNREILAVGTGDYDAAFFEAAARAPSVAFIAPDTRDISARLWALRREGEPARAGMRGVPLIPTAEGDPLLDGTPPDWSRREVVLSALLAERLGASVGDRLEGEVQRFVGEAPQSAFAPLVVGGVAPPERFGGLAVLAPLPLLEATENYLDFEDVTAETWLEPRPRARFASFRAYATQLEDIQAAAEVLEALGASARVRSEEAAAVLELNRSLGTIYAVIAGFATAGLWLSLTASFRAAVERQRTELGLLRLIGADAVVRSWIFYGQMIFVVFCGVFATVVVGLAACAAINLGLTHIAGQGDFMRLSYLDIMGLVAVCAVLAVSAAIASGRRAARVDPEEAFRRV